MEFCETVGIVGYLSSRVADDDDDDDLLPIDVSATTAAAVARQTYPNMKQQQVPRRREFQVAQKCRQLKWMAIR